MSSFTFTILVFLKFVIPTVTNLVIGSAQLPADATANRLSGTFAEALTAFCLQAPLIYRPARSPTRCPAAVGMAVNSLTPAQIFSYWFSSRNQHCFCICSDYRLAHNFLGCLHLESQSLLRLAPAHTHTHINQSCVVFCSYTVLRKDVREMNSDSPPKADAGLKAGELKPRL